MKILTFTTLYPNSETQQHGIFTQTSLRHVLDTGLVSAQVVAPIPWFPFENRVFGRYATWARSSRAREEAGLQIHHPRFPVLPKVGQRIAPALLAAAAVPTIGKLLDNGFDFDLIDAHYFYPDGVAAALLGRYFDKPVIIKALGSDMNVLGQMPSAQRAIRWAAAQSAAVTAVSESLRQSLVGLGVDGAKITVLRNGVDLALFTPGDRTAARAALGMQEFTLISVGNLVESKGHHLAIEALARLPGVHLMVIGSGPDRLRLVRLARRLGLESRVRFAGSMPQASLVRYYQGADALVLASSREGWANVLLEAMACGTPVVASAVSGTPEVVRAPCAGVLFQALSADGVAAAVCALRACYPARAATRRYAEQFSWAAPTAEQISLYAAMFSLRTLPAMPVPAAPPPIASLPVAAPERDTRVFSPRY